MFDCPYLTRSVVSRNELNTQWNGDLIKLICEKVKQNQYIFLYVDREKIGLYKTKNEHEHEFWIYGYDDIKRVFYCADNIMSGKYTLFTVDFNEVIEAYWSLDGSNYYTDIVLITNVSTQNWQERIDIYKIYSLFIDYIESRYTTNMGERYRITRCGFSLHERELQKIKSFILINENEKVDLRPLCVFKEHKKMMVLRLQVLNERYSFLSLDKYIEVYKECEKIWEIVVGLGVKYNICNCQEDIVKLLDYGAKAVEKEKSILQELSSAFEMIIENEDFDISFGCNAIFSRE